MKNVLIIVALFLNIFVLIIQLNQLNIINETQRKSEFIEYCSNGNNNVRNNCECVYERIKDKVSLEDFKAGKIPDEVNYIYIECAKINY